MALFDEAAPLDPEAGAAAPRIAEARRSLNFALLGFGKVGKGFFGTLNLPEPPNRIECYDISNTQGTTSVGSMVVFQKQHCGVLVNFPERADLVAALAGHEQRLHGA